MSDIFSIIHANPDAPTGLIHGEPDAEYRRHNWCGSTAAKTYHGSPEGFYRRYCVRDPAWQFGGGRGVRLGSLVDAMIEGTDSQRFADIPEEYITGSGAISTKKEAREWLADQQANGIEVCSPSELGHARMLADRLLANPLASSLLAGNKQTVARIIHPATGVPVQVRLDCYQPGTLICDLKTTADDNLKWWPKTCAKFGYDIQAGLYREAVSAFDPAGRLPFYHVVIQTKYPYEVRCYEWAAEDVDNGWRLAEQALEGIAARNWGTEQDEPHLLTMPEWRD